MKMFFHHIFSYCDLSFIDETQLYNLKIMLHSRLIFMRSAVYAVRRLLSVRH